jgi:hypothetical protein
MFQVRVLPFVLAISCATASAPRRAAPPTVQILDGAVCRVAGDESARALPSGADLCASATAAVSQALKDAGFQVVTGAPHDAEAKVLATLTAGSKVKLTMAVEVSARGEGVAKLFEAEEVKESVPLAVEKAAARLARQMRESDRIRDAGLSPG